MFPDNNSISEHAHHLVTAINTKHILIHFFRRKSTYKYITGYTSYSLSADKPVAHRVGGNQQFILHQTRRKRLPLWRNLVVVSRPQAAGLLMQLTAHSKKSQRAPVEHYFSDNGHHDLNVNILRGDGYVPGRNNFLLACVITATRSDAQWQAPVNLRNGSSAIRNFAKVTPCSSKKRARMGGDQARA